VSIEKPKRRDFGFPKDRSAKILVSEAAEFLKEKAGSSIER
jgi:hypothetical protein